MTDVLTSARRWVELDPDNAGVLAAEITDAEAGDEAALASLTARFAGYLTFGTAGLRAPLGPGTTRMNRVVVQRAAAGLADFALTHTTDPTVVIGYDARHGSKNFALDSAGVFTAAGVRVRLMSMTTPTPVLAFAMQQRQADIGIMVTASHNPPEDNGYKVYLGPRLLPETDAPGAYAQLTAPLDAQIAEYIHHWNTTDQLPTRATSGWEYLPETVVVDYVRAISHVLDAYSTVERHHRAQLNVVYTALHGVGTDTFTQLLATNGFDSPVLVGSQAEPDPAFPTVAFPNPEEPGALDEAIQTAQTTPGTDLIIAHDPDADRVAVAVPVDGQWHALTGDQLGLLLGARLMPYLAANDLKAANSVVSAPQLTQLAAEHGVVHETTPTGFKWICRVANLGYGYEEALGYAVAPQVVNDKDGLSAALVIADLAAQLKAEGSDLLGYLAQLTEVVGPGLTAQVAVRVPSPAVGTLLVDDLRANPPAQLAGAGPVVMTDYQDAQVALSQRFGPMNMLQFAVAEPIAARLMIRPSGTEPKVKCYIAVAAPPGTAVNTLDAVLEDLVEQAATLVEVE